METTILNFLGSYNKNMVQLFAILSVKRPTSRVDCIQKNLAANDPDYDILVGTKSIHCCQLEMVFNKTICHHFSMGI